MPEAKELIPTSVQPGYDPVPNTVSDPTPNSTPNQVPSATPNQVPSTASGPIPNSTPIPAPNVASNTTPPNTTLPDRSTSGDGTTIFNEFREYTDSIKDRWDIIYSAIMLESKRTLKNKWVIIITLFTWLWGILPQIALILIMIPRLNSGERGDFFDAGDFLAFYSYIFTFLVLFCGYISARSVTLQKTDRTISLYLCRPITKLDYLLIKFSVLTLVLMFIIVIPNILLFIITIGLLKMPFMWNLEHLWVLGSIILSGFILVSLFSLISLAIASSTRKMPWAIAGVFTFLFLSMGMSFIMMDILLNDYAILISPWNVFEQVAAPMFADDLPYSVPWAVSFAMLVIFVVVSIAVLVYNINKVEVVG